MRACVRAQKAAADAQKVMAEVVHELMEENAALRKQLEELQSQSGRARVDAPA